MKKRWVMIVASLSLAVTTSVACLAQTYVSGATPKRNQAKTVNTEKEVKGKVPKYVFLFIGDGMSYPQIQLTNYYLSANEQSKAQKVKVEGEEKTSLVSEKHLNMLKLDNSGSAQTYDSTSFAPDSASTATSIATGNKTWSGSINVSLDFSKTYETIAEKLKEQKGYEVGVVSSVNINHATPAAFYAHQPSRNNYYEIGKEMIASNFDYFAGGALKDPKGENEDQKDLYELAKEAGYTVATNQKEAQKLNADSQKAIVIGETLADSDSLSYEIDRAQKEWGLAEYVGKGIEVLNNDKGFFLMVEGGKIDWACHANDGASAIKDTIAFDNAIGKALEFYEKHPEDTLILVTGDHETGGLSIGYAGTDYDTFLTNLNNQKISYAKFDEDYVKKYKENKSDFGQVMKDITAMFGLQAPKGGQEALEQKDSADKHKEGEKENLLLLTDYEYQQLQEAYNTTLARTGEEESFTQKEYIDYGSYEPLTVTITHILNHKSGVSFTSYAHTGLPVAVLTKGSQAANFDGYYDNTDIYKKLAAITGVS